jgi:hypothetical protein
MSGVTKADLERENRALRDQLRRVETMAEAWRRRKGELADALDAVAPQVYASLVPPIGFETRYVILDRIVERATALALVSSSMPKDGMYLCEELEALEEAVLKNEHYWRDVQATRDARREANKKAMQTKAEREAING